MPRHSGIDRKAKPTAVSRQEQNVAPSYSQLLQGGLRRRRRYRSLAGCHVESSHACLQGQGRFLTDPCRLVAAGEIESSWTCEHLLGALRKPWQCQPSRSQRKTHNSVMLKDDGRHHQLSAEFRRDGTFEHSVKSPNVVWLELRKICDVGEGGGGGERG